MNVAQRRELKFASASDVIADVQTLRHGYEQTGNWNLPQICWHLTIAIERTGQPATQPATPEQEKMRPILQSILANQKLPGPVQSPPTAVPAADCNDDCVDKLIAVLKKLPDYPEKTGMHRVFGPLTADEYKQLSLIHCAHHLSHLVPTASS